MQGEPPLVFYSLNHGLGWLSFLRIPVAVVIFIVLQTLGVWLCTSLISVGSIYSLSVIISFMVVLNATIKIITFLFPAKHEEELRLMPGMIEWRRKQSNNEKKVTFDDNGIVLRSTKLHTVDLTTREGERVTVNKNWVPQFPLEDNTKYFELTINEGRLYMQGMDYNLDGQNKKTTHILCPPK